MFVGHAKKYFFKIYLQKFFKNALKIELIFILCLNNNIEGEKKCFQMAFKYKASLCSGFAGYLFRQKYIMREWRLDRSSLSVGVRRCHDRLVSSSC